MFVCNLQNHQSGTNSIDDLKISSTLLLFILFKNWTDCSEWPNSRKNDPWHDVTKETWLVFQLPWKNDLLHDVMDLLISVKFLHLYGSILLLFYLKIASYLFMEQPLSCLFCLVIKFFIIPEFCGPMTALQKHGNFSYVTPHLDSYKSHASVKSDIQYISWK